MHELHARKAPVDSVATYLILIDQYSAGAAASVPCPRCYADGVDNPIVISAAEEGNGSARCDGCRATYDFRAQG